MKTIAIRIRESRKLKNISQKELAEMIGVTSSAISQYETQLNEPSIKNLSKIAIALNISFEWLATGRGIQGIEEFFLDLTKMYKEDNRILLLDDPRAELVDLFEKLPEEWQERHKFLIGLTVASFEENN